MRKLDNTLIKILLVFGVVLVLFLSLFLPERLALHLDKNILNQINQEPLEDMAEGYYYALSANEKLYILSSSLNNMILPETELSEKTNIGTGELYEDLKGTYALVANYQETKDSEIQSHEVVERINSELNILKEIGIISKSVKEINASAYSSQVYSAIDLKEPGNNLTVWKVSLSSSQVNADKSKRVLDVYMDAETGKIYEFYVRIDKSWDELDPEGIMMKWSEYLGLQDVQKYENDNPLLETTPYYIKYQVPGMDGGNTIVTIGFYEGINELFLKISK